jgi:hypothetical protein
MNGKERVRQALARQPVDRIPLGFYAIDFDTAERVLGHETYLRAKAKTQIAFWQGRRDEVVQSWIEDTIALYRKLDLLDIVNLAAEACGIVPPRDYEPEAVRQIDDVTWRAQDGRVWKYSPITADLTLVHDPREVSIDQFDLDEVPSAPDESVFEVVDAVIAALGNTHYILGPSGGEAGMVLPGGMAKGLLAYAADPELVRRAITYHTQQANHRDTWYLRPGVDGVLWGTDFAATTGPFISPAMFREFCLPSIKERVRNVKSRGYRVFKHACGNNWKLLDMFVEAGYDAYQSIQASASMELKKVKQLYGNKLLLWGGVRVEHLMSGSPSAVREDVITAIADGSPDGGFILGTTHSIAVGTRYDNFMALLDAYQDMVHTTPQG